jgi:hypothetical protein
MFVAQVVTPASQAVTPAPPTGMPTSQMLAGAVTAVILLAITIPWVYTRFRKSEPDLARWAVLAVVVKILASIARYFVAYQIYGGVADAAGYNTNGARLASNFRKFDFSNLHVGQIVGTGFTDIVTGVVYALTGVSEIGGFFIFSWLGFLGLWLFFRAFRMALPEGDRRRYFFLVFFLPSMLFWPSEVGKEAWMTLGLGISAYAAARILTRRPFGYLLLLVGCAATAMVRPHVTVLFLAAFVVAFLLRRDRAINTGRRARRGSKIFGIVFLSAAMLIGVTRANSFFSSDTTIKGKGAGVTSILQGTSAQTAEGGSSFKPASITHPWTIPYAVVSVTFRPFPWESRNIQSFLASGEGAFLLYMLWRSRRRLRNLWPWIKERSYIALCLLYSALFAFAFSAVGNFGILARERVMQFPFFVVLLALPDHRPGHSPSDEDRPDESDQRIDVKPLASVGAAPLSRDPLLAEGDLLQAPARLLGRPVAAGHRPSEGFS